MITNHWLKSLKLIVLSSSGTALEFYDFTIYAYLASVINVLFFPNKNLTLSLIETYAVFSIGFLVRPLGSIIFGYIGDKLSRKSALIICIMTMAFSTFFIGLIPTSGCFANFSAYLLIIFRIIQGLSAGGEVTGAALYILEHNTKNKGFYGSFVCGLLS